MYVSHSALYSDDDISATYLLDDSAGEGAEDLEEACVGLGRVVYIGIDPTLSSAYIAGQLSACLQNPQKYTPILITYTPTNLAR